jgi:uncharacterized protein (UPF0335 family)
LAPCLPRATRPSSSWQPGGFKVHIDTDDGEGDAPLRNSVSGKELRDYIARIEYINEEQKTLSVDRQQIFKELKQAGYDRDTVRSIVARRKLTEEQREAADALMDQYMSALGDFAGTPLGQAGADRMRGGEAYAG